MISKTILLTGGDGLLAKNISKMVNNKYNIISMNKNDMDIRDYESVKLILDTYKPDYVIHSAAITKPMSLHDTNIIDSIDVNIIGTANMVKACSKLNIKLIYISTDYVYPKGSNNHKETDALKPINNYGWSKLGGEASVQMYKNSLIVRLSFIDKPFKFDTAYTNIYRNLLYVDETSKMILDVIDEYGVINIGGDVMSIFELATKTNPNVTPVECHDENYIKSIILDITKLNNLKK